MSWRDARPRDAEGEELAALSHPGLDVLDRAHAAGCPDPALLTALGEGVLPADEAARLRGHVRECPVCRRLAEDLAVVYEEGAAGPPPRFDVGRQPAGKERGARHLRWLLPAAGLGLAASIGSLMIAPVTPPARVPAVAAARPVAVVASTPSVFHVRRPVMTLEEPVLALRGSRPAGEDPAALAAKALDAAESGRGAEALGVLEELTSRHPESAEAALALGALRLDLGDADGAVRVLERARTVAPAALAGETSWFLAVAYVRSGRFDEAAGHLRALCADPSVGGAIACAGLAELASRRPMR